MKDAIRFLCLLCAGVVIVSVAYMRWDCAPPGHDPLEDLIRAGYRGEAPADFGGLARDNKALYVKRGSLHSLGYWNQMTGAEETGLVIETLLEADYSINEVRQAYVEAVALLQGGWSRLYAYTVQTAFTCDHYSFLPKIVNIDHPEDVYAPSVAEAHAPGYHVYVRLSGEDADVIWEKLKAEFGDMVQPWNAPAQHELAYIGPYSEYAVGWMEAYDPLVPIDIKSQRYCVLERIKAESETS